MLYLLLYPLHKYYSGFNALRYETLRSVLAGLAALALSLALGPILIDRFRALHIGQTIRDVIPQAHQKKAGTPTMGGLLIVASMLAATLLLANILNPYVWIAIFVTLSFGAIGFSDDYFKLTRGKGLGLSGPAKAGVVILVRVHRGRVALSVSRFRHASDGAVSEKRASQSARVVLHPVRDARDRRMLACGEPD